MSAFASTHYLCYFDPLRLPNVRYPYISVYLIVQIFHLRLVDTLGSQASSFSSFDACSRLSPRKSRRVRLAIYPSTV
jgi:hypothetical protein